MRRKIYFNWTVIIALVLVNIIFFIFGFLILFPAFKSPGWIIGGTFILTNLILSILWSFFFPFILIIWDDVAIFIGFPWITRIKLEKIERVVIKNYCFAFNPRDVNDYRFVHTSENEEYKGYKFISFHNFKAWGELIEFFKPISPGVDIRWNILNEEVRKYIEEKLYG